MPLKYCFIETGLSLKPLNGDIDRLLIIQHHV
jgi:hypothetical protein